MKHHPFQNPEVEHTFDSYPKAVRDKLLDVRRPIFKIAEESDEIGNIEETLKWGEPSYLTHGPRSGTTLRLSAEGADDDEYALSVHCQTSLMSEFRELYPDLKYDGNRSIIFDPSAKIPLETIKHFIFSALTYHYRKKRAIGI